ncbi:MAG: TolC family protein [Pseudomonadota bacterium]
MRRSLIAGVALAALLLASAAQGEQQAAIAPPAAMAAPDRAGSVLNLPDALALAGTDQPRIEAYGREAQASEEAAVTARSLPDPQVTAGIQNFPITGENAFSPTEDFMTMYTIGIMREQVRRSKREAAAQKILAEALVSKKQASAEERHIRREVMVAWINAVEARAKQKLLARIISDLATGRKVMEAGVPTGGSTPALVLQADAEVAIEQAQLADGERAERRARSELARWIGPAAYRPLPDAIPDLEVPLGMVPPIDTHPEVEVALAQQQVAEREVEVASQSRKWDPTWSVMLGVRPKYGEMVTATVSIPLQINRRNKQDRLVAEARLRADAAALRAEDARRALSEKYRSAVADYEGANAELARLDKDAIPALEGAFKAAEARYEGGGGGTLEQPFAIVRRYVEVHIQSVEAQARRARAAAEILHVHGETHQ